ncbi:hypothetical protein ATANTOWER_015174 [Ataeniobius toweri]|uniref:Uncharacterized protein n=1 Tax=Ataeniobius toweri TaxID=208326 RepID=A0ABU7C216_9TELE|nr:hypothetical protein [Ataeniobius toweri]
MEERTNAASWASGSRPSKSYADGSQYMASHDSLSPPYSNSRLTEAERGRTRKYRNGNIIFFIWRRGATIYLYNENTKRRRQPGICNTHSPFSTKPFSPYNCDCLGLPQPVGR